MIPIGNPGEKKKASASLCQKWEHMSLPPTRGLKGGQKDKPYRIFKEVARFHSPHFATLQTALRLRVLKLSSQHKVCERPQPVQICRIVIRVLQSSKYAVLPTPQCCFVAPRPRSPPAFGALYGIRSTSPGPTSSRFLLGKP